MGGAFDKAKQAAQDKASEYLDKDRQDDQQDQESRQEGAEGRGRQEAESAEQKGTVPPQSRREDKGEPGEEGWAHTEEGSGYRPEHEHHHHGSRKE